MTVRYPVVHVPDNAPLSLEDMGSKEKFWFRDALTGEKFLFKAARPDTGEDWAEKVAAELADLLGLPHAEYHLAAWQGKPGVVTPRFVPRSGALIHGNELLGQIDETYPRAPTAGRVFWRVPQHTLSRVLDVLNRQGIQPPLGWNPEGGPRSASELFVGYLLLDAWIGNTDRHHENWGLIAYPCSESGEIHLHLAPTFDHASSLGRELTDDKRKERLAAKDRRRSVVAYATGSKARSALYRDEHDPKPMRPVEALLDAALEFPVAAKWWADALVSVHKRAICGIFERVPEERMSGAAADFCLELLRVNRERILKAIEVI